MGAGARRGTKTDPCVDQEAAWGSWDYGGLTWPTLVGGVLTGFRYFVRRFSSGAEEFNFGFGV